jgi:hypothetical protein
LVVSAVDCVFSDMRRERIDGETEVSAHYYDI